MKLNLDLIDISRNLIVKALEAEGLVGIMNGYTNIHKLPIFKGKISYGLDGFLGAQIFVQIKLIMKMVYVQ